MLPFFVNNNCARVKNDFLFKFVLPMKGKRQRAVAKPRLFVFSSHQERMRCAIRCDQLRRLVKKTGLRKESLHEHRKEQEKYHSMHKIAPQNNCDLLNLDLMKSDVVYASSPILCQFVEK